MPHVQGDVHSAHRVHHSERNRFLNKDLRDFLTKDRNDLINLVVCRLHDSRVDAIFFLFVDKCPCRRGPVTGVLLHADEERHMLRPECSQHDAEEAYYQYRNDQERLNIANTPAVARREIGEQKSGTEDKEHVPFERHRERNCRNNEGVKRPDRENPDPRHPWPWREQQYERHHEFAGGASNMSDEVSRFRRT